MKFYVDTSVWGGHDDDEFSLWTKPFFQQAKQGLFTIVLSDLTLRELSLAPVKIKSLPLTIPPDFLELTSLTQEQIDLADKYIKEGALTKKFYSDAQHIAIATILKVDSLVSWSRKLSG